MTTTTVPAANSDTIPCDSGIFPSEHNAHGTAILTFTARNDSLPLITSFPTPPAIRREPRGHPFGQFPRANDGGTF